MHIIFDENLVPELKTKYIVLELDTILQPSMTSPKTLYALIDDVDIETLTSLVSLQAAHEELINYYKNSKWDHAIMTANALRGKWKGAMDEFYDHVIAISVEYRNTNTSWTGVRYIEPNEREK